MEPKNKIEVIIGGRVYTLMGQESEEYIQRVALYIDKKMTEVKSTESSRKLSTSMVSILTSINVADDLFKLTDTINEMHGKIKEMESQLEEKDKRIDTYENELGKMQKENIALTDKINELQLEIMKSKSELEEYINIFDSGLKSNKVSGDK